jgi:hypothetical protein
VAVPLHTTPGNSHPGCASTCPQAHPVAPSPNDGVCHHNPLRPPLEEHVMAPHQGHRTGASSLPALAQLVTPQHPPVGASLLAVISLALEESVLFASLSRAREVPHLHMQKTTTKYSINIYIIYIWTDISNDNINQNHTNILNIPRWSKTSPGGNTMSGSPRKSTPAYGYQSITYSIYRDIPVASTEKKWPPSPPP